MAFQKIGSQERFAVGDWRFFSGYCPYCKHKHFLTKDEAKEFIDKVSIFCGDKKNNSIKSIFAMIPKIKFVVEKGEAVNETDPQPINIVRHYESRVSKVSLFNFDNRYSEFGGLQWLRDNPKAKLREIADHYGFSANYAKRVKIELTKNDVSIKIKKTNICAETSKEAKKCISNGKRRTVSYPMNRLEPNLAV